MPSGFCLRDNTELPLPAAQGLHKAQRCVWCESWCLSRVPEDLTETPHCASVTVKRPQTAQHLAEPPSGIVLRPHQPGWA